MCVCEFCAYVCVRVSVCVCVRERGRKGAIECKIVEMSFIRDTIKGKIRNCRLVFSARKSKVGEIEITFC